MVPFDDALDSAMFCPKLKETGAEVAELSLQMTWLTSEYVQDIVHLVEKAHTEYEAASTQAAKWKAALALHKDQVAEWRHVYTFVLVIFVLNMSFGLAFQNMYS